MSAPWTADPTAQESLRTDDLSSPELDHGTLRTVMLDLVGRPPYLAEREEWLGRPLLELLGETLGREEFWRHWYEEQLYYFLLIDNFRPASESFDALPARLAASELGVREALFRIATSPTFDRRNPGADTFVTVIMEQLLGRTVQKSSGELEIGKRMYDGHPAMFLKRKGSSQADVVRIAVEDKGFYRFLLEREYARLVRAEPSRSELLSWAKPFKRNPYAWPVTVRDWVLSDAYVERLERKADMPNRLYIRALFVDLLDRLPEPSEWRRMRNALDGLSDPGPLRSVLARLLIDSGTAKIPPKKEIENPRAWIEDMFHRWHGVEPTRDQLKTFLEAYHDPACQSETIAYALLSHPDYHRY